MTVPQSVGIIMDGNRRFARELMKKPWAGHQYGVGKARDVLKWADEIGIKYMTIYALSLENLSSRPKMELSMIYRYMGKELDVILSGSHIIHNTQTQVKFIGRLYVLPQDLQKKMQKVEHLTAGYKKHVLNICVAYGGQQEIVDAAVTLARQVSQGLLRPTEINESLFAHHLYLNGTTPHPDLIIRTGGEKRLSNFLPWQSAYSELFFTDKKWPEFDKRTFLTAIRDFDKRQRKFGR